MYWSNMKKISLKQLYANPIIILKILKYKLLEENVFTLSLYKINNRYCILLKHNHNLQKLDHVV